MYITITPQQTKGNYGQSVSGFVSYLEKENLELPLPEQELFFNQHGDQIAMEQVIRKIDKNTLNLYKVNGINKRKASYQELMLSPIFRFNMPQTVRKGAIAQFVYVYSKFTLGNHEKLLVKLDELNGSRDVVFRSKK